MCKYFWNFLGTVKKSRTLVAENVFKSGSKISSKGTGSGNFNNFEFFQNKFSSANHSTGMYFYF